MAVNGKIAVVSGAAMGIGRAMTETLLRNGAKVVLLDVNETEGIKLKEILDKQYGREKTLFITCDVQSEEQVKAALQKTTETFGGIDILCNNAGILNEGEWEKSVSINLVGLIRATYLAMQHMSRLAGGRGGVVVNTASLAGLGPMLTCPVYTATKHAVVGFTRAMAAASSASGYDIRFNALCPCFVQTDLYTNIPNQLGQFSHLAELLKPMSSIVGVLDVPQIAECMLELVTDETKNGEALAVTANEKKYITFPDLK